MGSGFVAIWCQLGSNLAAKTLPKSTQVGSQINQNLHQDADNFFPWFLLGLGTLFCQFCFEVGGPRGQKTLKTNCFFFNIFAISANLPTRGHMIDFLANLALNLAPKIQQKMIKMLTKFLLHFSSLWGRSCVNFPSKLEGRGSQKYWKSYCFEAFLLLRPTCQQEAIWSIF